jgi:single-strand DNA-binding protein
MAWTKSSNAVKCETASLYGKKVGAKDMVNKAIIIGNLGSDPELSYTPNGIASCKFSVATSESWKDRNGQKQERAEWHKIQVWKTSAENCNKYLKKGSKVYIEGKIQTDSWEDKEGSRKYFTVIVASTVQFLSTAPAEKLDEQTMQEKFPGASKPDTNFTADDIPF